MKEILPLPLALAAALFLPQEEALRQDVPQVQDPVSGREAPKESISPVHGPPTLRQARSKAQEPQQAVTSGKPEPEEEREQESAAPRNQELELEILELKRQLQDAYRRLDETATPEAPEAGSRPNPGDQSRTADGSDLKGTPPHELMRPYHGKAAEMLFLLGRYAEARDHWQASESPWNMLGAAECLEHLGQHRDAEREYRTIVQRYPGSRVSDEATRLLGHLRWRRKLAGGGSQ